MDSIERFFNTIERKTVDRPASWLGLPDPAALPGLFSSFGVDNIGDLRRLVDDDIYPVELPYHSDVADAIYMAFDFTGQNHGSNDERTLGGRGFFADMQSVSDVDKFPWPDPKKYISSEECRSAVSAVSEDKAVLGVIWSAHFQDALAAFGMENALMMMVTDPELFDAVHRRIVDFYLEANEIFYKNTAGKLHAVLIGNDMGAQNGLMLSPQLIRELVLPYSKKLIDQAHGYGLKVIYHSCGSVYDIIPDLAASGADAIHPIQALARNMQAEKLAAEFGGKISFCGGVDAQNLLVNGTPDQVRQAVRRLRELFPTGLIISPSHEAILKDTRPENIKALFEAVK